MIYPERGFDARRDLEAVQAERATALLRRADDVHRRAEHPEFGSYDLRSLRTGLMAARPVRSR